MGIFAGLFDREVVLSKDPTDKDCSDRAAAVLEEMGFTPRNTDHTLAKSLDIAIVEYRRESDHAELRFDNFEGITLVAPRRIIREFRELHPE